MEMNQEHHVHGYILVHDYGNFGPFDTREEAFAHAGVIARDDNNDGIVACHVEPLINPDKEG